MSRWDKKTEGHSRSRREDFSSQNQSRSRSRSCSPVERRLRELDEERQRKEKQLREAVPKQTSSSSSGDDSDGSSSEESTPAPVETTKIGFDFKKPTADATKPSSTAIFQMQKSKPTAIQMSLKAGAKKETPKLMKPIANAFAGDDSDEEPEEMPAECRMRMRNIGRETPTSSGPNSFGKTKHGFCDSKKIFEKKMNSLTDG
ncbi:PEST proteolytic signal-containing nuclear protein-like [Malaya genurostris]|uniref:PEST proteolytic signal-containing nuclear protein-like n=1 Tax=Malaya genurostris TaxID=325434 RepID=UPI0026F3DD17|nr:PEST proteolytic signal-containing nuclear protein-like [Malaya genurostris]